MQQDQKHIDSEKVEYIMATLPMTERLCQLAEEASELAQAALKLRRVYDGRNPTPVSADEAINRVQEEVADVWLSLIAMGWDSEPFVSRYLEIMAQKTERLNKRLDGSCKH